MSYDLEDPIFKSVLGCASCPLCENILIKDYAFYRYFCPVCDKEEYALKLKEAKEKRITNRRLKNE
jgi:uncharacterized Zn finger protein (UPF0148 family)